MVNVRINYAHGIIHNFAGITVEDGQRFRKWLKGAGFTTFEYQYGNELYGLNRDFICSWIITPINGMNS